MATRTESGWVNWHQFGCRPSHIAEPRSLAELRTVLSEAAGRGSRVLVVGTGHSYNDLSLTSETLVTLRYLDRVEHIDVDRGLIRVQGGARLRELCTVLAGHHLAFAVLGDTAGQTIAGAISTGTHGTGLTKHSLSGQVTALQLMLADGSLREVSEKSDPDLFQAARCSLGTLGVVTAVTIRVVPAFTLCQVDRKVSTEEGLALVGDPPEIDHFKVWFLPYTDTAVTSSARSFPVSSPARPRTAQLLRESFLINGLMSAAGAVARKWPQGVPAMNRGMAHLPMNTTVIDRSDRIFVLPISIMHDTFEYAVPLKHGRAAVQAMLDAIDSTRPPLALPCEVRFQPAEQGWLDPHYDQPSVCVGAAWHRGVDVSAFVRRVEAACRDLGGRPHWAKQHSLAAPDLAPLYPMWDRFQTLRASLDPTGLFGSTAIDRYLGANTSTREIPNS